MQYALLKEKEKLSPEYGMTLIINLRVLVKMEYEVCLAIS